MSQSIGHDDQRAVGADATPARRRRRPSSPLFATDTPATSSRRRAGRRARRAQPRQDDRALAGLRIDVEIVGQAADRAETGAGRAGRRVSVGRTPRDVAIPGPRSMAINSISALAHARRGPHEHLAAGRVLHQVRRELGGDEAGAMLVVLAEAGGSPRPRGEPRGRQLARLDDRHRR